MIEDFRHFEARDPFGQNWAVDFEWLQTAISIRNSDSVDVKFTLSSGEERASKVVALPHPDLLELGRKAARPITDAWCSRLAASYLKRVIETGEDAEKTLITPRLPQLETCLAASRG
jgi:hypothetical protein